MVCLGGIRFGLAMVVMVVLGAVFLSARGFAAPPAGQFSVNGDGTVSDHVTGLMWQREAPNANFIWEDAVSYCAALDLAGNDDWRLPTVLELRSIVDENRVGPAIDTSIFLGTTNDPFWTATLRAGNADQMWLVGFYEGVVLPSEPELLFNLDGYEGAVRARCVR